MHNLNIALIGFGSVGQEFSRILIECEKEWAEHYGCSCKVVAIITRSKGSLLNKAGVDLKRTLREIKDNGRFSPDNPDQSTLSTAEIIAHKDVDLVIEITTLNIENGQPASDHIAGALKNGKHVITANKGPIAFHYRELKQLAEKENRYFYFEGTVMDGAPVFNLLRETLPGCRVTGFSGILTGTTNFILCEMAAGNSFEASLQTAQKMGWAEADPSLDLDGWDSAAKTAALLNVLMDAAITPHDVERTGISKISIEMIEAASAEGKVIKLLCEGFISGGTPHGKVAPVAIAQTHPLAHISGTSSTLTIETDFTGRLTIEIEEPKIHQTAYALVSDLLTIAKNLDQ